MHLETHFERLVIDVQSFCVYNMANGLLLMCRVSACTIWQQKGMFSTFSASRLHFNASLCKEQAKQGEQKRQRQGNCEDQAVKDNCKRQRPGSRD